MTNQEITPEDKAALADAARIIESGYAELYAKHAQLEEENNRLQTIIDNATDALRIEHGDADGIWSGIQDLRQEGRELHKVIAQQRKALERIKYLSITHDGYPARALFDCGLIAEQALAATPQECKGDGWQEITEEEKKAATPAQGGDDE